MGLKQGIYYDVSHEDYHKDPSEVPSLSASLAGILVDETHRHAWQAHPRLGGGADREDSDDTEASDRGTILHRLLLGRGADIVEVDAKDWRTNVAKDAKKEARAAGKVPVLASKMARHRAAASALEVELLKCGVTFQGGKPEATLIWESDGVTCRCRIDYLHISDTFALITDLKTSESANPAGAGAKIYSNGNDISVAAYVEAVETLFPRLAGRTNMRFAYGEPKRPYCASVVEPDGVMLELGRRRWARAKKKWREGMESGEWPGYTTEVVRVGPPEWALSQDMERGMSALGNDNKTAGF
jgi:hypothetical protein